MHSQAWKPRRRKFCALRIPLPPVAPNCLRSNAYTKDINASKRNNILLESELRKESLGKSSTIERGLGSARISEKSAPTALLGNDLALGSRVLGGCSSGRYFLRTPESHWMLARFGGPRWCCVRTIRNRENGKVVLLEGVWDLQAPDERVRIRDR